MAVAKAHLFQFLKGINLKIGTWSVQFVMINSAIFKKIKIGKFFSATTIFLVEIHNSLNVWRMSGCKPEAAKLF